MQNKKAITKEEKINTLMRYFSKTFGVEYIFLDQNLTVVKVSRSLSKLRKAGRRLVVGQPFSLIYSEFDPTTTESWRMVFDGEIEYEAECIAMNNCYVIILTSMRSADADCLKAIFHEINQGIIACDTDGKIILYNQAYGKIDGLNPDDVEGRSIGQVYGMDDKSSLLLQVMKQKKPIYAHRQQYVTSAGSSVDVVKDVYPIMRRKKVIGAFSIVHGFESAQQWAKQIINETADRQYGKAVLKKLPIDSIPYRSEKMARVLQQAKFAAQSDQHIAVFGDPGTEIDAIIDYMVGLSSRSEKPFLVVDCAAIPPQLIGNLLFGYTEGDLMSDVQPGFLSSADGGTLYLKNLEETPQVTQSMLQNYLASGSYYPLGGLGKQESNVRIITSFSSSQAAFVRAKEIKPMLMYSLTSLSLTVPSLRERKEDIAVLARWFFQNSETETIRNKKIQPAVMRCLAEYDWPGNMSELKTVIETAAVMSGDEEEVKLEHLPDYLAEKYEEPVNEQVEYDGITLHVALEKTERDIICQALQKEGGSITKAAARLGVLRQNLQYRIKKLKISV